MPELSDFVKQAVARSKAAGYVADDDDDALTRQEVLKRRATARLRLFEKSIPAEFAEAKLSDLEGTSPAPEILSWLSSSSPTLVLFGPVGVGKTHAAYAVARAAAVSGVHVAAATTFDLLEAMRPDAEPSPLPRQADDGADLFLFDDMGRERATDWVVEQIDAVMDARSRERLRQIVTTNLRGDQLRERYGDRVMSRLSRGARFVPMSGPDRRLA